MLSSQGVKPGSINMGRILRQLAHRSNQSRKVVYHRPPIYGKDNYGVENSAITTNEMLLPQLPALIRPALTADYQLEKAGVNIIGASRVYTPNIQTIKGMDNFNQENNTNFNEIEGWDRFIDNQRTIYNPPTSDTVSGSTVWAWTADAGAVTSDGESILDTVTGDGALTFTYTARVNTLEADRLKFQIKVSADTELDSFVSTHYNGSSDVALTYTPATTLTIASGSWLTIDVPFVSGTQVGSTPVASGTSIFQAGTRTALTVTTGSSFDYEGDLATFVINYSSTTSGDIIYVKDVQYYKSISWHVHSLKELNDEYMIFNCVRTSGKRDSRRRAYG